ncbi:MAG: nitroreductase family protein [Oscillibacter sp.]|jgi:nitroreductase|nr:nitroreductase family protein [Oscillibacter sp.]
MEFNDLALARYSLRKFSDKAVESEKLELILKAAQSAPTAHNLQPQYIYVVESDEARERLWRCTTMHYAAPVTLVVTYDPAAAWVRAEYDGKNHGEIDASIAATQMMLEATDLGLGTTYVGVFDPEAVLREFPEMAGKTPIALLPLGYPAEGAHPSRVHESRKPLEEFFTKL